MILMFGQRIRRSEL